jgi:hypothetical protein
VSTPTWRDLDRKRSVASIRPPSGRNPVLAHAALKSIADNLAAMRLDPVLHLKIAVAVVGPLMGGGGVMASTLDPSVPPKPNSPPSLVKSRVKNAAQPKNAKARKRRPEPVPTVYDGQIFRSRGAMAKHLAPILGKSTTTLARALIDAGGDAEAVVRRYRQEEPEPRVKALSHDEIAMRFLRERLAEGPFAAGIVDDEVKAGRLRAGSVEKAKEELGLVARRINHGRGSVVHLCLPDQAAGLEA